LPETDDVFTYIMSLKLTHNM